MSASDNFTTPYFPNWCPGCGNFGIWAAIKAALAKLGLGPSDVVMVYGIGCHGHLINFLKTNAAETLHGRPIAFAQGVKLANHKLNVIVVAGDGDTFGEGANHLIHAARRNINITVLVHNNKVYGLTAGQTSPTAAKNFKSKSTPAGVIEFPVNPLAIALAGGASFVARGFAGDIPRLTDLITAAISHKGFAYLDIFQPCVTFNHLNTYQWYREHTGELTDHNVADHNAAMLKALNQTETGGAESAKIPLGIFYQTERPLYEEQLPQLAGQPLAEAVLDKNIIKNLLPEFS